MIDWANIKPGSLKEKVPERASYSDGVIAGMLAALLAHPLDVLKIRLQISPAKVTTLQIASQLLRYEGWQGFYCGLTASLLRQATYTTTRLTIYDSMCQCLRDKKRPEGDDRLIVGICAGLSGGLVGNPTEVVLVRRIAEGCRRRPPMGTSCCHCPSSYYGTIDAFKNATIFDIFFFRIICTEGFCGLWRGTTLTLLRSVVLSAVYVGGYEPIRNYVKEKTGETDSFTVTVYSAVATSFVGALLTHPIDIVKTFYQASRLTDLTQREVAHYIWYYRGALGFWKGFTPYFSRMAMYTIVYFMVLDHLRNQSKL